MRKFFLVLIILTASCGDDDTNNKIAECIDHEKWGEINACPLHINYVCGCNNVTYDNECFAKAASVVNWTEGECK